MTESTAILIIDDDPDFLSMSRLYLEDAGGFSITTASSANQALEIIKTRTFDVMIADYHLPPGMNSIELLKVLKSQGDETPFIIFTGKSREEVAIEALNSGAAFYLQKGIEIEVQFAELNNMIRQLAEKKRAVQKNRNYLDQLEQQEKELREKNKELESFSYSISHDLRAPLRVISGYCGVITDNFPEETLPDGIMQYIRGIRHASEKMNNMIESLLMFSRAGRLALSCQEVNLSIMADEIVTSLRNQQPDRDITVEIQEGVCVYGDRTLLQMALQNLIDNSWKYTRGKDHARIAFRAIGDHDRVTCSVVDNGAGFDAQHAENLFMPFTRFHTESEFPGTGIGLATVNRIILRHDGLLWVESRVGEGANFFFTLSHCRKGPPEVPSGNSISASAGCENQEKRKPEHKPEQNTGK
jgi:signal transduction histidine kinase